MFRVITPFLRVIEWARMPQNKVSGRLMRTVSLICYCCFFLGFLGEAVSAHGLEGVPLAIVSPQVLSMTFVWQLILVLGLFVGVATLLSKDGTPLGISVPQSFTAQPLALGLASVLLVGLSMTSLPTLPLLVFAALIAALAWTGFQQMKRTEDGKSFIERKQQQIQKSNPLDAKMRLELGKGLLPLVSQEMPGNVVEQLASLRFSISETLGFTVPSMCLKDNYNLHPNGYRLYVRGGLVGEGHIYPDRVMIMPPQNHNGLSGIQDVDPVFGFDVVWLEPHDPKLGDLFAQPMDAVAVLMTHLAHVVEQYASELLSREAVAEMLEDLRRTSPEFVQSIMSKKVSLSRLHHILGALLEEQVPVVDLKTILETTSDWENVSAPDCVEKVRIKLRRQICEGIARTNESGQQIIKCIELPTAVEVAIESQVLGNSQLTTAMQEATKQLIDDSLPIVVVTSMKARRKVKARFNKANINAVVVGRNEIVKEVELVIVGRLCPELQTETHHGELKTDRQRTIAYAKSLLKEIKPLEVNTKRIEQGIQEIREIVGDAMSRTVEPPTNQATKARSWLIAQGIAESFAEKLINSVQTYPGMSNEIYKGKLQEAMMSELPDVVQPPRRSHDAPITIALVGPTGVGKTTTIAKLATKYRLQQGRSVTLVTADTYRIAAVDQLRQYANLFDAPFKIASTAAQMVQVFAEINKDDVVLIDTTGRSAMDIDRIEETANILSVANPTETHLVLSATSTSSATLRAAEAYAVTNYDRIIVTKLDEVESFGAVASSLSSLSTSLSWFTDGQDVSTHLEIAKTHKLVESVIGKFNCGQQPITCSGYST